MIIYVHSILWVSSMYINVHSILWVSSISLARFPGRTGHQILGSWDDLKYDVGMKDFVLAGSMTEPLTETTFVEMGSRCWKNSALVSSRPWRSVDSMWKKLFESCWPQTLLGYPGFFVRGHKSYRLINFYCKLAFWGRILCLIRMLF